MLKNLHALKRPLAVPCRMLGGQPWGYGLLRSVVLLVMLTSAIAEDSNIVILVRGEGGDGAGYLPLSPALTSVSKLAVEHVSEAAAAPGTNVTSIEVLEVLEDGIDAVVNLFEALDRDEGTFAVVSTLGLYGSAQVGSVSDTYLHLPILSVGGTRGAGGDGEGTGGYLLHVQPALVPQMKALVRLILDMKLARDAVDGRSETSEHVWVAHSRDTYGTAAAAAFDAATKDVSVVLPGASSSTSDAEDDDEEVGRAAVEIVGTVALAASSDATSDAELAKLAVEEASIVVLLAEGFDGAYVRAVLSQANEAGLSEGVQWFLPDVAAYDHIFDQNSTSRDADLAFDMRGMLGVRPCTSRSDLANALSQEWLVLDPNDYPGAGSSGLTADGQIDPLLAFVYDAVVLALAAYALSLAGGQNLTGFALDSCPFPTTGPWADGALMRESILSASTTLVGTTGPLIMSEGQDSNGRDLDTTTFCAVNLKAHASLGARFETISTLSGGSLEIGDGEGFQTISTFQEQTFPQGALMYPPDRPTLNGRHLDVVMKRDAPPFVFVDGDGTDVNDFTGITPEFLKRLSDALGFTYSLRAPPESTTTTETVEMVRNGSADMTGSYITITAERSEYVSFTYPYFDLGIVFVYKPGFEEEVDIWRVFAPFDLGLWLLLVLGVVPLVVFLLWLFEAQRGGWNRDGQNARGLWRSLYETILMLMGLFEHRPRTLEGYLLAVGILFAALILTAAYTAELAALFFAARVATTSISIEGLHSGQIPHSHVALLQGGNTQAYFEREFMLCASVYECSLIDVRPQPCYSTDECFALVMNGSALATVADSATAKYKLQRDCSLSYLPEVLYPQHYGLVLPFGSSLTQELEAATLTLREDGTLNDIESIYLDSTVCVDAETDEDVNRNMNIADVAGVFLVLGLFLALAMFSWFVRRSPWARARGRREQEPPAQVVPRPREAMRPTSPSSSSGSPTAAFLPPRRILGPRRAVSGP